MGEFISPSLTFPRVHSAVTAFVGEELQALAPSKLQKPCYLQAASMSIVLKTLHNQINPYISYEFCMLICSMTQMNSVSSHYLLWV